jgi:hypothetical protein
MTSRRNQLLKKLLIANSTEEQQKMLDLVVERILFDMSDFYQKFFAIEGPGIVVYAPKSEKHSMFYLNTQQMMDAVNDFSNRQMDEMADVMRKAIARAESADPRKVSLFLIQDDESISLYEFKREEFETIGII